MEVKIIAGTEKSCWCLCRRSGKPNWWDIPGVPLGGCRSEFISADPAWTSRNLKLCMVKQFNLLPIDLKHHGHKTNSCVHMFRSPASFNETLFKSKSSSTSYKSQDRGFICSLKLHTLSDLSHTVQMASEGANKLAAFIS